jgi:hypothetical protein
MPPPSYTPAVYVVTFNGTRSVIGAETGVWRYTINEDEVRDFLDLDNDVEVTLDHVEEWSRSYLHNERRDVLDNIGWDWRGADDVTEETVEVGRVRMTQNRTGRRPGAPEPEPQRQTVTSPSPAPPAGYRPPTRQQVTPDGAWVALKSASSSPFQHPKNCPCSACVANVEWNKTEIVTIRDNTVSFDTAYQAARRRAERGE